MLCYAALSQLGSRGEGPNICVSGAEEHSGRLLFGACDSVTCVHNIVIWAWSVHVIFAGGVGSWLVSHFDSGLFSQSLSWRHLERLLFLWVKIVYRMWANGLLCVAVSRTSSCRCVPTQPNTASRAHCFVRNQPVFSWFFTWQLSPAEHLNGN